MCSEKKTNEEKVYCWRFWYQTADRIQYYYIADTSYSEAIRRWWKWIKLMREFTGFVDYQDSSDPSNYMGEVSDKPGTQSNTRRAFTWRR